MDSRRTARRLQAAVALLTASLLIGTAPGRIPFPDDEIVFQTTRALWEEGSLAIPGIPKRSGEVDGQEKGTFGWAPGPDGRRYGFFGHGLSAAALPFYGLARLTFPVVPELWRHAIRPDHHAFHRREPLEDWTRLVVSLTNCVVTGLAAAALLGWLVTLGFGLTAATLSALAYALGTLAWPTAHTFLSEPLSGLCLILAAAWIGRYHATLGRARAGWLWAAGAIAGLSVHVHVLNLSALPCLLGYALWPLWREGRLGEERRALAGALVLGALGIAALGLSHYLRFGSPFETGRFGIYSRFVPPWTGLAAFVIAPGRSLLIYAPAATIGLFGWPALRRRLPRVAWFVVAMVAVRALTIATRSDWFGGWALGPRHLVPVLPFAVAPLAILWDRFTALGVGARVLLVAGNLAAIALCGYLSLYSIFEWMFRLGARPEIRSGVRRLMHTSHWDPAASPIVGFWSLEPDLLVVGAWRLAERGHGSFFALFVGVFAITIAAAAWIVVLLRRRRGAAIESP